MKMELNNTFTTNNNTQGDNDIYIPLNKLLLLRVTCDETGGKVCYGQLKKMYLNYPDTQTHRFSNRAECLRFRTFLQQAIDNDTKWIKITNSD